MRLNKYLSSYGVCSRREADRAIGAGRVMVNGKPAVLGQDVDEKNDTVFYDGIKVTACPERIVIAYNKPAGVVCSTKSQGGKKNDIISEIGIKERIFPVGRLDKDTTGLILLTNDGELTDRVLRAKNGHEKEYEAELSGDFTGEEIAVIERGGIPLEENRATKPCRVIRQGNRRYTFILTEGMNRQIRKVCEYFGKEVVALKRVRFINIRLGDLKEGEYRYLTKEEIDGL